MRVKVKTFIPHSNTEKMKIDDLCQKYVEAEMIEENWFNLIAFAVNKGFNGNNNDA